MISTGISPLRTVVMSGVNVDETLSRYVDVRQYSNVAFYVTGSGTISSGVITFEEADWDPDTDMPVSGTWSSLGTMNASTVSAGATIAFHLPQDVYSFVRARITTTVADGTVTIVVRAN